MGITIKVIFIVIPERIGDSPEASENRKLLLNGVVSAKGVRGQRGDMKKVPDLKKVRGSACAPPHCPVMYVITK